MNQAPTLGKMRKDKGVITPTLILPPQGGGDARKDKNGFPFPVFTRTGSMGMTERMGTIHRAPT